MRYNLKTCCLLIGISLHKFGGHPSSSRSICVQAFSTTTPQSFPSSKVVTTVTPKNKKTLHFRKDFEQQMNRAGNRMPWDLRVEQDVMQCHVVGTLSKHLLDQIPPVMKYWARNRTSESAAKSQLLLQRYVDEYTAGNIHATLEVRLFNIAMDAWAKSRRHDAPQQIQKIMKQMQDLRSTDEKLSTYLIPDVISMSCLCLAWAKCRVSDGACQATAVLDYMEREGLRPNTITYNSVLLAHVHSQSRDKAILVESIIAGMKRRHEHEGLDECRPDVYSYQALIAAWSRTSMSGTPQKAEEVLHFLGLESRMGKAYLTPNCHCYVAAIHAWSHSEEHFKSRRAYEILCHMRDLYERTKKEELKPNVVAYTAVLNACALPVDKSERESALAIALLVMEELRVYKYDRPNFLTYSAFLHVLGSTISHGTRRDQLALKYFREAQVHGQVGYIVLEKLHTASPNTYDAIAEEITEQDEHGNNVVHIPYVWGKNVVGERDPLTRVCKDDTTREILKANYIKLQQVKRKRGMTTIFQTQLKEEIQQSHLQCNEFTLKWSDESLRS